MGVWLWLRVREPVRLRLPLCVGDPVGLLERVADGDAGTKIERTRSLAVSACGRGMSGGWGWGGEWTRVFSCSHAANYHHPALIRRTTRANVPAALSVIPLGWLNDAADPTPSALPA